MGKDTSSKYRDINGNVIKFGQLVVGIVNGRMCLAARETLILLGVNITTTKVPSFFIKDTKLMVIISGARGLPVWVINRDHLDPIARNFSYFCTEVKIVDVFSHRVTTIWSAGRAFNKDHEEIKHQTDTVVKKLSLWQRIRLRLNYIL